MAGRFGIPPGRIPLAIALVAALALTLSWLQGRLDQSDVKKAIAIALSQRRAPGGPSVFEVLVARGQGEPRCDGKVVSQLLGDVEVRCTTPGPPAVDYEFRVLLDGKRPPRPVGAPAEALMNGLDAPRRH